MPIINTPATDVPTSKLTLPLLAGKIWELEQQFVWVSSFVRPLQTRQVVWPKQPPTFDPLCNLIISEQNWTSEKSKFSVRRVYRRKIVCCAQNQKVKKLTSLSIGEYFPKSLQIRDVAIMLLSSSIFVLIQNF